MKNVEIRKRLRMGSQYSFYDNILARHQNYYNKQLSHLKLTKMKNKHSLNLLQMKYAKPRPQNNQLPQKNNQPYQKNKQLSQKNNQLPQMNNQLSQKSKHNCQKSQYQVEINEFPIQTDIFIRQVQPAKQSLKPKKDPKSIQQIQKKINQFQFKRKISSDRNKPFYNDIEDTARRFNLSKLSRWIQKKYEGNENEINQHDCEKDQKQWYVRAIQTHFKQNSQKVDLNYSTQSRDFSKKVIVNKKKVGTNLYPKLSTGFKKRSVSYEIKYI